MNLIGFLLVFILSLFNFLLGYSYQRKALINKNLGQLHDGIFYYFCGFLSFIASLIWIYMMLKFDYNYKF